MGSEQYVCTQLLWNHHQLTLLDLPSFLFPSFELTSCFLCSHLTEVRAQAAGFIVFPPQHCIFNITHIPLWAQLQLYPQILVLLQCNSPLTHGLLKGILFPRYSGNSPGMLWSKNTFTVISSLKISWKLWRPICWMCHVYLKMFLLLLLFYKCYSINVL